MSWRMILALLAILPTGLFSPTARAGVYNGTVDCTIVPPSDNFCGQGMTTGEMNITPFAITHSPGYAGGSPGSINLEVCVDPSFPELINPTQWALAVWAALTPQTGQCPGSCFVKEEGDPQPLTAPYHAGSTILHELGHCAMGLDHPNLEFDPPGGADQREITSFTTSYDGSSAGISAGPDGIRGSFDDMQQAGGGVLPESVNWFRVVDNNPIIIDTTVIDLNTFSRSVAANLPVGHEWSANANRLVAQSLGAANTQSVMYSVLGRRQTYTGLTADDVNMIKMAMTGEDLMAGTSDDYVVTLTFVQACTNADIRLEMFPLGTGFGIAGCDSRIDFSFPPVNPNLARHYSVVPFPGNPNLTITLNSDFPWDFTVNVFTDGFESGNLSTWSLVVP